MHRLLLVGFGDVAQHCHLPAIEDSSDFRLCGVVESDPDRFQHVRALTGVPVFSTIEESLGERPTCAIIATPPEVTPHLVREALNAGLHVLCEKPISTRVELARDLSKFAEDQGKVVQVGFTNRFAPFITETKELIESNALGSPLTFTMSAFDEVLDPDDLIHLERIKHFLEHGSAFSHEGSHMLDYLSFFGSNIPKSIYAHGIRTDPKFASENFTTAMISFENGNVATLEVGWLMASFPMGQIHVIGPKGRVEIVRRLNSMTIEVGGEKETKILARPWNAIAFEAQLKSFGMAIVSGKVYGASLEDGLYSLKLSKIIENAVRLGSSIAMGK